MTHHSTAIDDVIVWIVATLKAALSYPVFDGPPSEMPDRDQPKFVAIGAESPLEVGEDAGPITAADMSQVYKGLGGVVREEELHINCVAVGKTSTIAEARGLAVGVIDDVSANVGFHPGTLQTWNALVSDVVDTRSMNVPGGAVVQMQFVITVRANLS
jgi:hypothetical protein